jgi:hypothetical protein
MNWIRNGIAGLAVLAAAGAAYAQDDDLAVKRTAIAQLRVLEGEWEGTGWIITPDGTRREFRQRECVRQKVAGLVTLIEGTGWAKDAPADAQPVFQAMMTVHYDTAAKTYRYRTFESVRGQSGDGTLTVFGGNITWGFPAGPGARIVYRIMMDGDTWHETGTREADGQPPFQFFEMTVHRTAGLCTRP